MSKIDEAEMLAKAIADILEQSMVRHGYVGSVSSMQDDDYEIIPDRFDVLVDGNIDLLKLERLMAELLARSPLDIGVGT